METGHVVNVRRHLVAALLLFAGLAVSLLALARPATDSVTRHPLETRALVDPEGVLKALPDELKQAVAARDFRTLALLELARANACRVIADWSCQRSAGANARKAAQAAGLPELEVRGLIAESRAAMAMQDFARSEHMLGDAERLLALQARPDLAADVFLAYSSLSYALGKHAVAAEYAERGLAVLEDRPSPTMRVRLLRNRANALAQLGQTAEAEAMVRAALILVEQLRDPKLKAELHLEDARIARMKGDVARQQADGRKIVELGNQLGNSQLFGLGHEVLGLASRAAGDGPTAEKELRLAAGSFEKLKLKRDERRVLRVLVQSLLGRGQPPADFDVLTGRLIALETELDAEDQALAGEDFDAKLTYARQQFEVRQLESRAALAAERQSALAEQGKRSRITAALSLGLLLVAGGFMVSQRRFNNRLRQVIAQLRDSEARYRMLADNSRDMVVSMRLDGSRSYVSPASRDLLGLEPGELAAPRWDILHPDDRDRMAAVVRDLGKNGGAATVSYRVRHRDGHYIWVEASARLAPAAEEGSAPEIVYSSRDVSARVRAEQALAASEARMRTVTDNIPALIAHIDSSERYLFANAFIGRIFGVDPQAMVGRTMREVRGEAVYAEIREHVEAVLRGELVSFEGQGDVAGKTYFYQSNYVPDRNADGEVQGFFALTFDITDLKMAEAELDRVARLDSLSGLANRRDFEERLGAALARGRRLHHEIALLFLDIDRFKSINDKHGHAAGDAVITEFAKRVKACVREDDVVARLGGDEFIVLIENPGPESTDRVAEKLLEAMRVPFRIADQELPVTTSIGIAHGPCSEPAMQWMARADQALYLAKSEGRNCYRSLDVRDS